jgi:hypothetical protein
MPTPCRTHAFAVPQWVQEFGRDRLRVAAGAGTAVTSRVPCVPILGGAQEAFDDKVVASALTLMSVKSMAARCPAGPGGGCSVELRQRDAGWDL